MAIARQDIKDMYQSGARRYDATTLLFRLLGLRMNAYRLEAVRNLALKRGDFVIELGCGTGLNFPYLLAEIGPEGRLVGVDITPGMLELAQERIERSRWDNVKLVTSDITDYPFPENANGVIATGLFGYIPEYDRVIRAVSEILAPGGRISILDGKQPEDLPPWLFSVVLKLGGPFGYTPEYFEVRPWESVERYFAETTFETRYGGMIYLSSGEVPKRIRHHSGNEKSPADGPPMRQETRVPGGDAEWGNIGKP